MATQCSICGKPLGRFVRSNSIFGVEDMCDKCVSEVRNFSNLASSKDLSSYFEAKNDFYNRYKESPCIETLLTKMDDAYQISKKLDEKKLRDDLQVKAQQEEIEAREKNRIIEEKAAKLLITTGSYFDGYVVDKYIDVIHEELIFKNSFIKQISAGFEDFASFLSFKERELTGTNSLISRAHSVLMQKFRFRAAEAGANAILGIDFETSFGSDVVCAAVNGTAVVIRKKEEA